VFAINEKTGNKSLKKVTQTYVRKTNQIYVLTYETGNKIETTWNHPFYIEGKGWTEVRDIKLGDHSITLNGESIEITAIKIDNRNETVYNFTVEDEHNYYVGDSVLVHNSSYDNKEKFDKVSQARLNKRMLDINNKLDGLTGKVGEGAENFPLLDKLDPKNKNFLQKLLSKLFDTHKPNEKGYFNTLASEDESKNVLKSRLNEIREYHKSLNTEEKQSLLKRLKGNQDASDAQFNKKYSDATYSFPNAVNDIIEFLTGGLLEQPVKQVVRSRTIKTRRELIKNDAINAAANKNSLFHSIMRMSDEFRNNDYMMDGALNDPNKALFKQQYFDVYRTDFSDFEMDYYIDTYLIEIEKRELEKRIIEERDGTANHV
jgi:hypothetical protein